MHPVAIPPVAARRRAVRTHLALAWALLAASGADGANPPDLPGAAPDADGPTAGPTAGTPRELVLNGDFEQTTLSDCALNLPNDRLERAIAHLHAFGAAGQIDVLIAGAHGATSGTAASCIDVPPPPSGRVLLGLASESASGDAVAIELRAPVRAGHAYTATLEGLAVLAPWAPDRGRIQIGLARTAGENGVRVFEASPETGRWSRFTHRFIAPLDASHLVVRQVALGDAWSLVDRVSLTDDGPVPLADATLALLARSRGSR
jgi:hypothetical protein